jgi:hypothetical protein
MSLPVWITAVASVATLATAGTIFVRENAPASMVQGAGTLTCGIEEIASVNCEVGQVAVYAPRQWGNQQYPVILAGYICSFDHPIVWNDSAFACVYAGKRGMAGKETKAPAVQK